MNIQKQNTIDKHGRIFKKDRLTHDQSFKWADGLGTSVNRRIRKEHLLPCMFWACIRQIVVMSAQQKTPRMTYPHFKGRLQVCI
jgi:hypothetical protein